MKILRMGFMVWITTLIMSIVTMVIMMVFFITVLSSI